MWINGWEMKFCFCFPETDLVLVSISLDIHFLRKILVRLAVTFKSWLYAFCMFIFTAHKIVEIWSDSAAFPWHRNLSQPRKSALGFAQGGVSASQFTEAFFGSVGESRMEDTTWPLFKPMSFRALALQTKSSKESTVKLRRCVWASEPVWF